MLGAIDITGRKFGRLTAVRRSGRDGSSALWEFRCDCGATVITRGRSARSGRTKSCGCLKVETWNKRVTKHGMFNTPEYVAWRSMKCRCFVPTSPCFRHYGGRGITVCEEWKNSFDAFYKHIGPRPTPHHSIDRINNGGNYEPGNVRWATRVEQGANQRHNRILVFEGKSQSVASWAKETGIPHQIIRGRLYHGWPVERVLLKNPTRKNARLLTAHGKTQTICEWSRELNISLGALTGRLKSGWTEEESLTITRLASTGDPRHPRARKQN